MASEHAIHDWRRAAACLEQDPDLFFPDRKEESAQAQIAEAKIVCAACLVLAQCRELELTPTPAGGLRNEYGVFAGMAASERRAVLRGQVRRVVAA